MPTIQDAIRSAEKHAADVQSVLDTAGFQHLIRRIESHTAIVEAALDAVASVQASIERTGLFAEVCVQLKWPPPWHMPSRLIDQITAAYHAGRLTQDEMAGMFASFYTPERIEEFGQRWATYAWLPHRLPILQESLGNHMAGRYYSAVCVLLPQLEGVLREALGAKPTSANSIKIIRGDQLDTAAGKFYAEVVLENFSPQSAAPIPDLSRHAILHGTATNYGTPMHSLKLILIADIILSIVQEGQNEPVEDVPTENEETYSLHSETPRTM